jgi:hypothetical protein
MATLNANIDKIIPGSPLDILYNRLLAGFLGAQSETLPDFTGGEYMKVSYTAEGVPVYEADEGRINAYLADYRNTTMKNSAYLLASSIAGESGDTGGGGEGGGESGDNGNNLFVAITGDTMTGKLNAQYGFTAGANGVKILEVWQTHEEDPAERKNMVTIDGELHLKKDALYINEENVMSYDNDTLTLKGMKIVLDGDVECTGSIRLGDFEISKDGITMGDKTFYHSGNANLESVDWTMKNGTVAGNLLVKGTSDLQGAVAAVNGVTFGAEGNNTLTFEKGRTALLRGDMDMLSGGLMVEGQYVVHGKNINVVSFSAPGRILNLGDDGTQQINLQTDIYDDDGEYRMIGKFGDAYFPNSFRAGHHLGNTLIETYKKSTEDAGVVFSRYARFYSEDGPGLYSEDGTRLTLEGSMAYTEDTMPARMTVRTDIGYKESDSLFAPLNRRSATLAFATEADFYEFDKPVEGKTSIGIAGSKTRIADRQLFFGDSVYWQGIDDGVKHYGNAYMTGSVGSVSFSSGFAGNGWKIQTDGLTGNTGATFDELTIRKKMRVYELEVNRHSVTNGSLWVSDSCSGDTVEEVI